MNRIRKYNGKFQVLITPSQIYNAGYELLRGSWYQFDDNLLKNYKVEEFDTLGEAQTIAFTYPDVEWDKLVLMHQNAYIDIKKLISDLIQKGNFIVEFEPVLMDSLTLKNTVFNRVMNMGNRFNISYQMNGIISFNIINPWSKNLKEITQALLDHYSLRLKKLIESNGITQLIGETPLGTTYEIRLWPTVIYQWARWASVNNIRDKSMRDSALKQAIELQNTIDNSISFR